MHVRGVTLLGAILLVSCTDGPTGPPVPAGALRFIDLDAGYYHTCGLTVSGTVFCWGRNFFGTLGDGTREERVRATPTASSTFFTALDAGAGHNCVLAQDGHAWCWGQNDEGQVGDGTFTVRDEPVAVTGNHAFTQVSAGHAHSCGLATNGVAWCWGDDSRGQLGNGADSVPKSASPVQVTHGEPFTRIVAGHYDTCGITASGAYCWGANDSGQLGDGGDADAHVPAAVTGGSAISDIAVGDRFACGIASGAVSCWGANRHGELGGAATGGSSVAVPLEDAPAAAAVFTSMGTSTVSSADAYGCLLQPNGNALCWGGAVSTLREADARVTNLDTRIRFDALALGTEHICGLGRNGYAYCGGTNGAGQLGDGTHTDQSLLVPIPGPRSRQ